MSDHALAGIILNQISKAAGTILTRFSAVPSSDDFTSTPEGREKLDSICMLLIVIGESLKNLDKVTNSELLVKYSDVDWKKAMGMRDILTHHYSDVNPEAVFNTCRDKIPLLLAAIRRISADMVEHE
ncbi:MAG: DUF86 domain-containing protein [Candidatus Wallbacteria bacterium]|nr:DUF86 domain-containing protein [Candidatus Wallbacteria bacterium]